MHKGTVPIAVTIIALVIIAIVGYFLINHRTNVKSVPGDIPSSWQDAGIENPEDFRNFFLDFKKLVEKNDKEKIAKIIKYPIGSSVKVSSEKEFIENYDQLFTSKVKEALKNQTFDQLWRNYQGVMVGNGEIWLSSNPESGYWIIAINSN